MTAKSCGIGVRTLSRKMRLYGLDRRIFKKKPITHRNPNKQKIPSLSSPQIRDL
jgi:hypothetical protein